ncbi:aspartate/glutamate racemase family protein [Pandoraea terrae]|nr:aspartate/glutamate racemase family protein [Pandoraea terrae]
MREILLLNPNTSEDTTAMMLAIARASAPAGYAVRGATAARGVPMIVDAAALNAAGGEVLASWRRHGGDAAGVVISAFGDPGIEALQDLIDVPVVGICESSMREAAHGGRRFGVATVTPELVGPIDARAHALGLGARYTGVRLTPGDPEALTADPARLEAALAQAVSECITLDGAQAVIIGGGPLGQAAIALAGQFDVPIIAPIPAAMRRLASLLAETVR